MVSNFEKIKRQTLIFFAAETILVGLGILLRSLFADVLPFLNDVNFVYVDGITEILDLYIFKFNRDVNVSGIELIFVHSIFKDSKFINSAGK